MTMNRILALATATVLAACGGGGGDAGNNTNYDALAAWGNFLAGGPSSWSATGVATDAKTYQLALGTSAPIANSRFPPSGAAAIHVDVTATLTAPGGATGTSITSVYYDANQLVIGTSETANGGAATCSAVPTPSTSAKPPAIARVGASGPLFSADQLAGCTAGATKSGSVTSTWSLETESGIVYFCFNSVSYDLSANVQGSENDCVEIDPAGKLGTRARFSVSTQGFTLTARTP
jgi:hypothetical protein